jgi:hypothetical protein
MSGDKDAIEQGRELSEKVMQDFTVPLKTALFKAMVEGIYTTVLIHNHCIKTNRRKTK